MGIVISALNTVAHVKREAAAAGGVRQMALSAMNMGREIVEQDEGGNIITRTLGGIWSKIKGLLGVVWKGLQFLGFSIVRIVGAAFAAVRFFWNYNWRESLATLNQQTQERFLEVATEWSGFLGRGIGTLVCGALPGVVLYKFNPAFGLYVLKEFGEEALDNFLDDIDDVVTLSVKTFLGQGVRYLLYGVRYLATPIVKDLFGKAESKGFLPEGTSEKADQFLEDDEPWTFAKGFDNLLKSVPGGEESYEILREFFDEAFDACYDAGILLAEAADLGMAQHSMQRVYTAPEPAMVVIDTDPREEEPTQQP